MTGVFRNNKPKACVTIQKVFTEIKGKSMKDFYSITGWNTNSCRNSFEYLQKN